jgi:hypothetical protein
MLLLIHATDWSNQQTAQFCCKTQTTIAKESDFIENITYPFYRFRDLQFNFQYEYIELKGMVVPTFSAVIMS